MTLKKVKPTTKKAANVKKPAVKKPTVKSAIGAALKKTKAAVKKKVSASAGKKAPAKTSAKKTPPTKTAKKITKKTSVTEAASPKVESGLIQMAVTPTLEERYRMVETAAYFIAEQHGFHGRSDEHWAAAERAIAGKLGQ